MKKIILTGYMGAGKSVIAHSLSEKTGLKSLDLDEIIEKKVQLSIREIFDTKGEIYFRRTEHEVLKKTLEYPESFILSLGGGTPCYAGNDQFLNGEDVISFYLKASIPTLTKRLAVQKHLRPVIAAIPDEELEEFVAMHVFDRSYYYNKATFRINTDDKSVAAVTEEIIRLLA